MTSLNKLSILTVMALSLSIQGCGHSKVAEATNTTKFDAPKHFVLTSMTQATAECPRNDKTWRKLNQKQLVEAANACAVSKNWERVDAIGEHLAGLAPQAPWGAFYMSLGSLGLERYPRALWMADLSLKKSPRAAFLHYQKGRVLWGMGEFELSVRAHEETVKYDPGFLESRRLLAQVYFRDREFKKAKEHFLAMVKYQSSSAEGHIGLAESLLASGDQPTAIKQFETAVDKSPSDLLLRLRLAEIYENAKMMPEALVTYRKAKDLALGDRKHVAKGTELIEKIRLLEKLIEQSLPGKKLSLRAPAEDEKRSN